MKEIDRRAFVENNENVRPIDEEIRNLLTLEQIINLVLVVVKIWKAIRPVMVAQLAKQLLQIPEIRSSNTIIDKFIFLCVNCLRINENKEHQAG